MANAEFHRHVPLGAAAVGWHESEIDCWIEDCLRKRDSV
jgi:predicted DNA-binding transcriptional regulator AlpA